MSERSAGLASQSFSRCKIQPFEDAAVGRIQRGLVEFTEFKDGNINRGGSEDTFPLTCFMMNGIGVDVAVFELCELQKAPLNPADGRIFKRLDLAAAEALTRESR